MKATMKESFLNTSPKTIQEEQGVQSPVPGERRFVTKAFFGGVSGGEIRGRFLLLSFTPTDRLKLEKDTLTSLEKIEIWENLKILSMNRHLAITQHCLSGLGVIGDSRNCMSSVQKSKRGSSGVNAETDSFDDTDDPKESPIPNMESSTVMEEIDAKHGKLSESSEDPPYGRDFVGGKPTGRFSNGKVPGDFISEAFGCKPIVPAYLDISHNISEFATGVNFASAGTGLVAPIAGLLIKCGVFYVNVTGYGVGAVKV
ncbi:hypothetical protein IFM89_000265 [Coptis chinensis]|uniref:Uncharacterized protein n=1 Tax=Coptis chinensis TaxID=261450 RepID=A0A835LAK6_9MAGN|nr:hypothetical protein IFM89_000265 [Coptis chinensis]